MRRFRSNERGPMTGRTHLIASLVAVALLSASSAAAQKGLLPRLISAAAPEAPLLRLHIKPSKIDTKRGTAVIDVEMTVERMKVAAGQPLLTHSNMAPAMRSPMAALDLKATDDRGPVALVSDEKIGVRTWNSTRDVEGALKVTYRRPIDNGHLGSLASIPHVDGQGVFGIMNMLFLIPKANGHYRVALVVRHY